MSPVPTPRLLPRRAVEDSPLSITGNVIGIVTLVFAVGISIQVYLVLLRSAKKDLKAMKAVYGGALKVAETLIKQLEAHGFSPRRLRRTSNLALDIQNEDLNEIFGITRESFNGIRAFINTWYEAERIYNQFFPAEERLRTYATIYDLPQLSTTKILHLKWQKWKNRVSFRRNEASLKQAFVLLDRQTESLKDTIVKIEYEMMHHEEAGCNQMTEMPRRFVTPLGVLLLEINNNNIRIRNLERDFIELLAQLKHHLPRQVISSSREYWAPFQPHPSFFQNAELTERRRSL